MSGFGLRALLVDPSLFTAPYDAALTRGLLAAGVQPSWAVRPTRAADKSELVPELAEPLFYRWIEQQNRLAPRLRSALKGVSHLVGLARLVSKVIRTKPDVVHFQWVVVPPLDSAAIWLIGRLCPVLLTVHDTVPYNGETMSLLQSWGFELPLRLSTRLIVHTQAGRERLLARGVPADKLAVIPHGALPLAAAPSDSATIRRDPRYCFVLFGELKHYKGIDVLVEALGQLPQATRANLRVIVAGRPRMNLSAVMSRIAELGLEQSIELRPARLTEAEMAELFAEADAFVFPYRQIDASGVYYLVKSLQKWLIASRVGIFAEDVREGQQGELVPVEDARALARALAAAATDRRTPASGAAGADWTEIGERTQQLYREALVSRAAKTTSALTNQGARG